MSIRRTFRVAGVSFVPGYPENLLQAREHVDNASKRGEALPVVLRRNPANPHDANAIEVHVPAFGMVGHVPKDLAARMAGPMDRGVRVAGEVQGIAIDDQHPDRPGCEITVWQVTDLDDEPQLTRSEWIADANRRLDQAGAASGRQAS